MLPEEEEAVMSKAWTISLATRREREADPQWMTQVFGPTIRRTDAGGALQNRTVWLFCHARGRCKYTENEQMTCVTRRKKNNDTSGNGESREGMKTHVLQQKWMKRWAGMKGSNVIEVHNVECYPNEFPSKAV